MAILHNVKNVIDKLLWRRKIVDGDKRVRGYERRHARSRHDDRHNERFECTPKSRRRILGTNGVFECKIKMMMLCNLFRRLKPPPCCNPKFLLTQERRLTRRIASGSKTRADCSQRHERAKMCNELLAMRVRTTIGDRDERELAFRVDRRFNLQTNKKMKTRFSVLFVKISLLYNHPDWQQKIS